MTVNTWTNRKEDIETILEQEIETDDEIEICGTEITELSFKDSLVQDTCCFTDEDSAYYHVTIAAEWEGDITPLSYIVAVNPTTGEMEGYTDAEPL